MWSQLGPIARRRAELTAVVDEARGAWSDLGAPDGFVGRELDGVSLRLAGQHATVGVFGLIKRGKSTLVNALVGLEASRTRAVPETAVPVRVTYGPRSAARVHLVDGRVLDVDPADAHEYTSQSGNAGNQRGVVLVEREVPSPILEAGVDVVDLPGLDDAEADETYTARTLQQLDTVDAGVVVFQSPPTVSATELAFLQEVVARHHDKVVVVCNLYPQHYLDEDTRGAVLDYTRKQLQSRQMGHVEAVGVCALALWESARDGDRPGWEAAGGAELERALEGTLLRTLRAGLLRQAGQDLARVLQVGLGQVELLERGDGERSDAIVAALRRRLAEPPDVVVDRRRRLDAVQVQARAIVQQVVKTAEPEVAAARSADEVRIALERFRRALEVKAEEATRIVVRQLVDDAGRRELLTAELAEWGEATVELEETMTEGTAARAGGAAVGGVLGGAGLTLLATALGPVGLVAGALAGSWLGRTAARTRSLRELRGDALNALPEIADRVTADIEQRTEAALGLVERREEGRRDAFEADLRQVLAHLTEGDGSWRVAGAALRELCARVDAAQLGADRVPITLGAA